MAAGIHSPGSQSPTSVTRTIEKVFDESQYTGEINLSGRKLKDYPKCACKYDLVDTTSADLSKNRFSEIPSEICCCHSVERLNCYHNVIKCIPAAIVQLQNLVYLNLSRNLLSVIPPCLCHLKQLEVLLAGNNRLVSLPEEIGKLQRLQQLDVSCNEISHLPDKIGDMERLRSLDVRKNLLVELPISVCRLRLRRLDFSCNRIAHIPCDIRKVDTLEHLVLDNNPLLSPPANICTRGLIHIMKFLNAQARRNETKKDVLGRSDSNLRGTIKRSQSCLPPGVADSSEPTSTRSSREPISGSRQGPVSSGYWSTTERSDRSAWSRSEINPDDLSKAIALRRAESVQALGSESHSELSSNGRSPKTPENGMPKMVLRSPRTPELFLSSTDADEFTRELQRQKSDYDAKRKRAEQLRLTVEEAEKDERRRAAQKLKEQQHAVMQQHQQQTSNGDRMRHPNKEIAHSRSFSEVRAQYWQGYQRTNSDSPTSYNSSRSNGNGTSSPISSSYGVSATTDRLMSAVDSCVGNAVLLGNETQSRQSLTLPRRSLTPAWDNGGSKSTEDNSLPLENEFRRRHEAMVEQQRRETYNVLRRLEDMQRSRVSNSGDYAKQTGVRIDEESSSERFGGEVGSISNASISIEATHSSPEINADNNGAAPCFTIRRSAKQAETEREQQEQLRKIIETVLSVKLPEDLSSALHDGVILCHLANHMRPHSVTSIHVPSSAVPKLTLAKCRRNVDSFLLACRRIGVNPLLICPASAVLEDRERGLGEVAVTVRALVDCTALHIGHHSTHSAV